MNTGIRLIVCTALISVSLTVSVFTLAALTGFLPRETEEEELSYVLGEAEGRVAVYQADAPDSPLLVTGIDLSSLRRGDRELIAAGLPVESREELARLLEDLGR